GFSIDDLRGFMLNGIDAAWVDDGTRANWRHAFTQTFDGLRTKAAL
ncbi:MAG: adenosine deaminase, partial [Pseudomonadota bacterium]